MAWFQDGQGNNQEVNDPETQRKIGDKYYDGDGVTQDYNEAVKWYRLAADLGDAEAQNKLGRMYASGEGVKRDYLEALKWFRLSANQGFPNAQFNLGTMYEDGEGVTQDYNEAVKWYRLAADQGFPDAQFGLACMYANGQGVKQDYSEAMKWVKLAANQGLSEAQYNLGTMYDNGDGVKQDYSEAIKWYRLAADQGFPDAQYNLGVMYANGQGVKQDYSEAMRWYRLAADHGYDEAQISLGTMYDSGQGVKQDHSEAMKWYRLAAEQGNSMGQYFLAMMYEYGDGVEVSLQKAAEWFRKSADQGYDEAQLCVGVYYLYGRHYPVDIKEALKWFRKSADQGNAEAKQYLDYLLTDNHNGPSINFENEDEANSQYKLATVCVESLVEGFLEQRLDLLKNVIVKLSKNVDLFLFPAGFFDTSGKYEKVSEQIENGVCDAIRKCSSSAIVCVGVDALSQKDQFAIALNKDGVLAMARKFFPTDDEAGVINLAGDPFSGESKYPRTFLVKGKMAYLAVCYDSFGIRKKSVKRQNIDLIVNLIHGFNPKGESGSGDVYFAKHGLAGSSKQWGCPTYAAAVFSRCNVPPNWPTGVMWNQGIKSTQKWKYVENTITQPEPLIVTSANPNEKAIIRIFYSH